MSAVKGALKELESRYLLWRGIRRFRSDLTVGRISELAIHEMWMGWGNIAWSASPSFALISGETARSIAPKHTLEFGAGLTTLVLGLVAEASGTRCVSIDHEEKWCDIVDRRLKRYGIRSVDLHHRPLKDYGDFDWYDDGAFPSLNDVGLIVVDGPPGFTKGGRQGIVHRRSQTIAAASTIILDDVSRPAEWSLACEIAENHGLDHVTYRVSTQRAFSVLSVRSPSPSM